MGRTLFTMALGLALSGCWVSDKDFFGPGDWAHLDLDGTYISEDANGHEQGTVVLTVRPDGLVDGVATREDGGEPEKSTLGLVPVNGGSGEYYILVDQTDGGGDGQLYLLGHLDDDGSLEMYWPECSGTPDIEGMTRETPDFGLPSPPPDTSQMMSCTFTTKESLQEAALEAERFLSAPHIVDILPMGRITPKQADDTEESTEDETSS